MILISGAAIVAVAAPAVVVARPPIHGQPLHVILCVALAAAGFTLGTRLRSRVAAVAGLAGGAVTLVLLTQVTYPGGVDLLAAPLGLFLGAAVAPMAAEALSLPVVSVDGHWRSAGIVFGFAALAGFVAFWTGSTSPHAQWLGPVNDHGDRDQHLVALTFDDGPNPEFSLAVAQILDERGVKGTFFEVGKAVAQRPDITATLLADGQVIGNHSYLHDAVRYLDPRYPELDRAERAIATASGVCPALFRPPHGAHTPFMSWKLWRNGMTMVTWDVSAKDWVEDDPERLANNILAKVKPGSIILLHDGLDGNIPADRSVVVRALPAILDGLRARGLTPVTVPELLHVAPYLPEAACGRFK